jgi:hypothetical protein
MQPIRKYLYVLFLLVFSNQIKAQFFFVSPSGNDHNPGTKEQPFKTILKAKESIQKINDGNKTITVYLREGVYALNEPLVFNQEDGAIHNGSVTYSAYNSEKVILRGSKQINRSYLKNITDEKTRNRIPAKLKDSIFSIDLKSLSINHIQPYKDVFNDDGGIIELFMHEKRLPIARYPNTTDMTIKKVLINGGGQEAKNEDWADYYNGKTIPKLAPRPGVFEYRDPRTSAWINALDHGVWIKGFWRIPWQNEAVRISKIDTLLQTITLAAPIPGGIGNKYTRPEGNGKEPYWIINLLEEIDQPGEWAIDFKDKKLYIYPDRIKGDLDLHIADLDVPLIQLNNTNHLAIKNLIVEENMHDGIKITGGEDNLIAGCTIRNVTKNGITVDGGKDHTILSNDIYEVGAGGIWLKGGDENSNPKVAANFKVINNHIYKYSQITKVYAAGINAGFTGGGGGGHHNAVGMYIAHNKIHDAPHVGILYGSWNSVFEYNEVYDYCQVSDDMGAFYSYDQSYRMGGHTFAYNYIHDTNIGDGIYFDEDHRDMKVYGNIIALNSDPKRRGTGFLFKSGTQAKSNAPIGIACYNNIAINCNVGYQFVSLPSMIDSNKIYNNVSVQNGIDFRNRMLAANNKERDTAFIPSLTRTMNKSYKSNPGFVDFELADFKLRADSQIYKDLPGFQPIPFEKIGLFIDAYRKALPSKYPNELYKKRLQIKKSGTEILDRG